MYISDVLQILQKLTSIYGLKVPFRFKMAVVGCWNKKYIFFPPTLIFSKTFFLQKMRINNTNLTQKTDWKKLNTFEVMVEKPILTNPLGEWRHLVKKFKTFFHNFFSFSTRTQRKKPIEEIFIKKKVTAHWNLATIFNFRRQFVPDKKLFFYEICVVWWLTNSKKENVKIFDIGWVMVKKPFFNGHF
jgi:hypothetical protein